MAENRKQRAVELTLPPTDIEAGLLWLNSLGEPRFRDSVLLELFRKMREQGQLEWFENIHGRLDKGVDYILVTQSALERQVLGIQVKGKPITRAGGNGTLSAVDITNECEAAMKHEFQVEGAKRRLDSIALWCSAHITPDAEEEFSTPGLTHRIQIKKPREVFSLIEHFSPGQLSAVPQLTLVRYMKAQTEPEPEGVRVFGCRLNPKEHFLDVELSEFAPATMESMKTESGYLRRRRSSATLDKVLHDDRHTVLFAGELSGKSYLQGIFKGWYLLSRPIEKPGDSTAWYSAFWDFLSVYLEERFGSDYCLQAGSSIDLHTGANLIPRRVIALTARGGKMQLELPHNTSVLVYQDAKNLPRKAEVVRGVRAMPLTMALCRIPPSFFENQPLSAEIALRAVRSVEDLTRAILETESPTLASRFTGAYQFLGDTERAEQIGKALRSAGIAFEPQNPFVKPAPVFAGRTRLLSAYAGQIEGLFKTVREPLFEVFNDWSPKPLESPETYLDHVEAVYTHDAYNSLSIEGYRVTPELLERIGSGSWNPDGDPKDQQEVAAMAAKGYLEAFRTVKRSVARVLQGESAGQVFRQDYSDWYRAMFSESVRAGLLQAYHLAGHRNAPVYIRASRHVPPPHEAVNDAMTALLDLLQQESEPIVRAVLGHWLFGFIHPYMDGNGRMARFLMNLMMASGGYPWTIVRATRRKEYLDALEAASADQNILPFAKFIREEMSVDWAKEPARR